MSNGNNDSITVLDRADRCACATRSPCRCSPAPTARLKGVQPVSLALDPRSERSLYVAEAGLNAVGVVTLDCDSPRVVGSIPTGWWPASVEAHRGRRVRWSCPAPRGAAPGRTLDNLAPKHTVMGTLRSSRFRAAAELDADTQQVLRNNGFARSRKVAVADGKATTIGPRPTTSTTATARSPTGAGVPSRQIKHVIFINKENATHDLMLGDITATRQGVPVDGDPAFSLGPAASAQPPRAGAELHRSATTSSSSRPCRPTATAG